MGNKNRGLYGKFWVRRTDGRHVPGEKHDGCDYFVLDLTHDPHAIPAIRAYADSCGRDGYELLARDLLERVAEPEELNARTVRQYPPDGIPAQGDDDG